MAVNDLWEIAIRGVVVGQPIFNVFHYITFSQAGGAPTQSQILVSFRAKVESSLLACCTSLYNLKEYTCQLRYAAGAGFNSPRGKLDILTANVFGVGAATVNAPQLCMYIRLYAEQSPAVYLRGGKFIGGLSPGMTSNGQLTGPGLTAGQTLAGKFADTITMGTGAATLLKPVVYSPSKHKVSAVPYVLPITTQSVTTGIKTLRRRSYGTKIGGY